MNIDEFVFSIGLDPSKFNQGQKDALENFKKTQEAALKLGKSLESQGAKVSDVFMSLKRGAIGMVATLAGGFGLKEATSYITNLDAATGRAAKTLNMGVKELSIWQGMAEATGGSTQGITGAMQGLSGAMNTFMLTGQGEFLQVMSNMGVHIQDNNKKLYTADQMFTNITRKLDELSKTDPARAAALMAMVPGANQDSINLMIMGAKGLQGLHDRIEAIGGASDLSAENAAKLQEAWAKTERSATGLGRAILNDLTPYIVGAANALSTMFTKIKEGAPEAEWVKKFRESTGAELPAMVSARARLAAGLIGQRATASLTAGASGSSGDAIEDKIRRAAVARGIDPNVAIQVYRSEGKGGYVGDRGSSFGPYQLHYGGMAGGGMAVSGLGDEFTKKTGLHARDPSTVDQQIAFSLDYATKHGWGAWHGWKGSPQAGLAGARPLGAGGAIADANRGASSGGNVVNVNIGTITTQATNSKEFAEALPDAMKRTGFAISANNGGH